MNDIQRRESLKKIIVEKIKYSGSNIIDGEELIQISEKVKLPVEVIVKEVFEKKNFDKNKGLRLTKECLEIKRKYINSRIDDCLKVVIGYKMENMTNESFDDNSLKEISSKLNINVQTLIVDILGKNNLHYKKIEKGEKVRINKNKKYKELEKDYIAKIRNEIYNLDEVLLKGRLSIGTMKKMCLENKINMYNLVVNVIAKKNRRFEDCIVPKVGYLNLNYPKIKKTKELKKRMIEEFLKYGIANEKNKFISISFMEKFALEYKVDMKNIIVNILNKKVNVYNEYRQGILKQTLLPEKYLKRKMEYIAEAKKKFENEYCIKRTKNKYNLKKIQSIADDLNVSVQNVVVDILGLSKNEYYLFKKEKVKSVSYGEYEFAEIPNEYVVGNYKKICEIVKRGVMRNFDIQNINIAGVYFDYEDVFSEVLIELIKEGNLYLPEEGKYAITQEDREMSTLHRKILYRASVIKTYKVLNELGNDYEIKLEDRSSNFVSDNDWSKYYSEVEYKFENVPKDVINSFVETMSIKESTDILIELGYNENDIQDYIDIIVGQCDVQENKLLECSENISEVY